VGAVANIARAPAFHFFLIGAVLFALDAALVTEAAPRAREPIVISATRVTEIRDDYHRMTGIPPTPAELAALVDREADDEMLYREALLLGLDRGDPAVDWRVIEKMHSLFGEAAGDDATALRRGLELGLHRDDVVVRSGLITKMRLLARGMARAEEPSGDELEAALRSYFEIHKDEYARAEELSLVHVFLRGPSGREVEAGALREKLVALDASSEAAVKEGDPFPTGNVIRATSRDGLVKLFGDGFAGTVRGLEEGRWSEPIRSPFGLHLVRVTERRGVTIPDFDQVRSQVLHAYRAERQTEYLARLLEDVRQAYDVRVEIVEPADG
jgi:hypothetical protein